MPRAPKGGISGRAARADDVAAKTTPAEDSATAWRHHEAGRLGEAAVLYERVLRRNPRDTGCLHLLGVVRYQEGRPDLAVELILQAISLHEAAPVLHAHLGEAYRALGRFDDAITACRRALELKQVMPDALNTLGAALHGQGETKEAVATLRQAVEYKPDLAEAHANLGNALRAQGDYDEAAAAYDRALRIDPDFAGAIAGLGATRQAQGRSEEAVAGYRRALRKNEKDPLVWSNLGVVLRSLGSTDEAMECLRKAVRLAPDFAAGHANLGMAVLAQGEFEEAAACYRKALTLERGATVSPASARSGRAMHVQGAKFRFAAEHKLRHDIEQFEYLMEKGRLAASFATEIDAYRAVLAEIADTGPPSRVVALTSAQQARIGSTYNRAVHIADAPAAEPGPLNPSLDVPAIEDDFRRNAPGVTFFDDFLTAEALAALRRFCLESTIWYDFDDRGGHLGADLSDGFNCGLLFQIAGNLRKTFPDIVGERELLRIRGYNCDSQTRGTPAHADPAAVNVTFWMTPDDASLDGESGRLVVSTHEAPREWDFKTYNRDPEKIQEFLAGDDSISIPHRQNRALIFNGNLLHMNDGMRLKAGYENRWISITMLFGLRENQGAAQSATVEGGSSRSADSASR